MRILGLTVYNLGVFRGRHRFDFTPVLKPNERPRHLVIVSGHNGVGKSTLFQALNLALHRSLSVSDLISRADYNKHLLIRLHRFAGTGVPVTSRDGGVELSFKYV